MSQSVAERYLTLGLQIGRHVEGIVDSYYGPPELAAAVEAEPPVDPAVLVSVAEELLLELEDGWLRDQIAGLRTYAGVLAGESRSYADEAEGCYGVRPTRTDEAVFAAAHDRLDELLTGEGALAGRVEAWEASIRVPSEKIEATVAAVIEEARAQTRGLVALPEGEGVALQTVRDVPWMAFCEYQGALRSEISVNLDLPLSALHLLVVALHETYPGHHTEACCKEDLLVRGRGMLQQTIALVPTPQSLITEGIATVAPTLLLEGDGGPALADVTHRAGIELDLAQALAVEQAREPLRWAEVNAALMLQEDGLSEAEVHAYLVRWALLTPQLADHVIRFFKRPASRNYIVTYPAGRSLCEAYVAGDPSRFRRLLTEPVRVGELLEARHATASTSA
ncbi:MAG TPA: hypothetical protein VH281_00195 [Gaiellaceae bacterium]